jgi:2-C-methyl-D-erythritol 4-phosphate cytidylyltransferase
MHILIPAAGRGQRMGSQRNKLLLSVLGCPLLGWTLRAIAAAEQIEWIGLVSQPEDWPDWQALLTDLALTTPVELIKGGASRQESVYNGLQALPAAANQVLIHDGARCLATPNLFNRCATALQTTSGLIAAIPVKDTIKVVNDAGVVEHTPDRAQLWAAQTPQGFWVEKLKSCHEQGREQGWEVTDDAALFERLNLPVQIVPGEETNLKITTPEDLPIAELILQRQGYRVPRTGD